MWVGQAALVVGLVGHVILAWWAVAAALVLVTAATAHGHGWTVQRYVVSFGAWTGALALVAQRSAVLSVGGGSLAWDEAAQREYPAIELVSP